MSHTVNLSIPQPLSSRYSVALLGVDLAKRSIQLHGVDATGAVVVRRAIAADTFVAWCHERLAPGTVIAIEACASAHHDGRALTAAGFTVRLIAPHRVTPYRLQGKAAKNDANDAAVVPPRVCEAASRPPMLFVAVKSIEQQALLLARAFLQGTIEARTALVNRVRGALLEFGIALPQGIEQLRAALPRLIEPTAVLAQRLPGMLRSLLEQALEHCAELDARIDQAEAPITQHAREDARARMVGQLQGIGPLGASALVAHLGAHLGDMSMFTHARQPSAWLGVVPAQHSSGGKVKLSGISPTFSTRRCFHANRAGLLAQVVDS